MWDSGECKVEGSVPSNRNIIPEKPVKETERSFKCYIVSGGKIQIKPHMQTFWCSWGCLWRTNKAEECVCQNSHQDFYIRRKNWPPKISFSLNTKGQLGNILGRSRLGQARGGSSGSRHPRGKAPF